MAMLWVLNLSDGTHSLLDIADRAGLPFTLVCTTAQKLQQHGLLDEISLGAAICEESQGGSQRPAQRAATPNAIAIAAAVQLPALGRTPPIARWYGSHKWNTCGPERLTVCKQRHQLENDWFS